MSHTTKFDSQKYTRYDAIILWCAIALFFVFSALLYWVAPHECVHFKGDSTRYQFLAHEFQLMTCVPLEVLGYPFFLRLLYWFYDGALSLVLAQIVLSIGCLFFLRYIVRQLVSDPRARTIVTLLWVLNLGFLIYTQLALMEVIYAFFLIWFIERMLSWYARPTYLHIVQAALVLSASVLIRPAALFYIPILCALLLFVTHVRLRVRLVSMLLFVFCFYAPINAYMLFNYWWFGQWVLCPVMDVNLFYLVTGFYARIKLAWMQLGIAPTAHMRAIDHDIAHHAVNSATKIHLIKLCLQQPVVTAGIWLKNMLKTCVGLYQTQWKLFFTSDALVTSADRATSFFDLSGNVFACFGQYISKGTSSVWLWLLGWYEVLYLFLEYGAGFLGMLVLYVQKKYWVLLFALSFVGYFALITGPDGSGRFRMMLEPWLLPLAVLGVFVLVHAVLFDKYANGVRLSTRIKKAVFDS